MPANLLSLNQLAKNCIEDNAPHCVAACPFHMDLRAFSAAVAQGDLMEGRRLYEERVVLPHLMCRICDAPCMTRCLRKGLGGSILARPMEQTCMDLAPPPLPSENPAPPKRQGIAVVGSGLSGLYAAATLVRRGFPVTVFDAADRPGGRLLEQDDLQDALQADLAALKALTFNFGAPIGTTLTLQDLAGQFAAVCVCWGSRENAAALGDIDPTSGQTAIANVFAGGSLLGGDVAASPSLLAQSGSRAALSAERLVLNVSIGGNRSKEGVYESALVTNVEDVVPQAAVPPSGSAYTAEAARTEAARCIQCHCLECQRKCVYLQHYDRYSGSAIRPVIKNVNIIQHWGYRFVTPFINSCAVCGLCAEVCPADIDMGYVNVNARAAMWDRGDMPPAIHDFPLRDMEYSVDDARLVRHQPGHTTSRYMLFPGCQMPGSMPETLFTLYRTLAEKLPGGVGLFMACCGAPADWAGREGQAAEVRAALTADWEAMGRPTLLLCCPGCYKVFKEHLPDIPVKFIAEVLPEVLPDAAPVAAKAYAYHDPCTSRHLVAIQDSGRAMAQQLGAQITELPANRNKTVCCSYGGLQYHVNPTVGRKSWGERIAQSPLPYLTSCSNCRDFFRFGGKECLHILELAFGAEPPKGTSGWAEMDFSLRRHERRQLLERLKTTFWQEAPQQEDEALEIIFSDEVLAKMYAQNMLVDDARDVIREAEATGRKIYSNETGHFIATQRLRYITFWVEYTLENERVLVHNCYTHRMRVLEEGEVVETED
ncbi:MAG: pyridine nucleotide-disulfide oxidoreductase/dicluster-binding protein [Oscillospiraceae bacterium]